MRTILILLVLLILAAAGLIFAPQLLEGTGSGCEAAQSTLLTQAREQVPEDAQPDRRVVRQAIDELGAAEPDGALAARIAGDVHGSLPALIACPLMYYMPPADATAQLVADATAAAAAAGEPDQPADPEPAPEE